MRSMDVQAMEMSPGIRCDCFFVGFKLPKTKFLHAIRHEMEEVE
jgi:hypothetical protein